jgi:hypothetical protein
MLGVLEELMERARERFWAAGDRLRMIRLLGRQPAHAIDDRRVAEVFAASYALRPVGEHAFVDLQSDMSKLVLENHVKEIMAMWPDLSRKGDPEKARQSLIDLVQSEMDRIWAIAEEHEQNAGDEPARIRRRRAFVNTKEAEAMLRSIFRSKSSLERGIAALRKEKRARKADSDVENAGQVIGKDISPYDYDGRPHSWWMEQGGNGGQVAAGTSGAAVGNCRENQADGTRRVPDSGQRDRGWDSVMIEDSDVVACRGFLPERYTGIAGDVEPAAVVEDEVSSCETGTAYCEAAGRCETGLNAGGAEAPMQEERKEAALQGQPEGVAEGGGGCQTGEKTPNELNLCDDVFIAQHDDVIEVPTTSGGFSGLDNLKTKPNFLQTKPMPAGGLKASESGGVDDRTDRTDLPDRTDSVADAQREREAVKARMWQQFVRMQAARWGGEPGQPAMFQSGVSNGGEASAAAGEPMVSQDARGP